MQDTVLIYLEKNDEYLLLYRNKKNNDMNKGKYIGIGGKVEVGETVFDALKREVKEETNLDLCSYEYKGIVYFHNDDFHEAMHLFTSIDFKGQIKECDEGTLHWVKKDKIMSLPMWEGDKIFFDYIKNNEPFFKLDLYYKKDIFVSWEKRND